MLNDINKIIMANKLSDNNLNISEYLNTIHYCFKNHVFFMRVSKNYFDKKIINPALRKRISLYGNALPEFLIDENPNWEEFPKRSRSLIGLILSTNVFEEYTSPTDLSLGVYGNSLYFVFPKNLFNNKTSFYNGADFISILKDETNYIQIYEFYRQIGMLFHSINDNYKLTDLYDFEKNCDSVDKQLETLLNDIDNEKYLDKNFYYNFMHDEFNHMLTSIFMDLTILPEIEVHSDEEVKQFFNLLVHEVEKCLSEGFKDFLWNQIPTYNCSIFTKKSVEFLRYSEPCEFWTEEECLLVHAEEIKEFLGKINLT